MLVKSLELAIIHCGTSYLVTINY